MDECRKDKKIIQYIKNSSEDKKRAAAKKRLSERLVKNMETIMIGALEEFEKGFGYLWGHDKDGEFSEQEQAFYDLWQEVRTEILDRANLKILQSEKEIEKYNISVKKIELPVKGPRK